jgi:DNA-binding CsgD family transcriptional regulator
LRPHLVNFFNLFKRLETLSADHFFAAELAGECELLSKREAEVASLLCRRMRAEEIATMLLISPRTAETHIEHIYTKLNVRSRHELLGKLLGSAPVPQ